MKWTCFVSFYHGPRVTLSDVGILGDYLRPKGEQNDLTVSDRLVTASSWECHITCGCQELLFFFFLSFSADT